MTTPDATGTNPTHPVTLSDGINTYGLKLCNKRGQQDNTAIVRTPNPKTAVKIMQGNAKYSDMALPYASIAQEDWSGGRGNLDFDKDLTKFFDCNRLDNSLDTKLILGGQEYWSLFRSGYWIINSGTTKWIALSGATSYLARKQTASGTFTGTNIWIMARYPGTIKISWYSDNSGAPGTEIDSTTLTIPATTDYSSQWYKCENTCSLSGTTNYWVVINGVSGITEVGISTGSASTSCKQSTDGNTWANSTNYLYYRITAADTTSRLYFFQYRGAQYGYTKPPTGASVVYLNGDRGVADANTGALTTLVDASKLWTPDEWIGCRVVIIRGDGSSEEQNWRLIMDNDATTLTVSPAWNITHSTNTEYVIVGSDKWTVVAMGITAPITDVINNNNILYLAQGEDVAIRRYRFIQSGGAVSSGHAAENGKATFLCRVPMTTGKFEVWKGNNSDTGTTVSRSDTKAWGDDLAFGTGTNIITIGDVWDKITGLISYGDPEQLWVMKQGSVWGVLNKVAKPIPLPEMGAILDDRNGKANLTHNLYMYFSMQEGVQRYYKQNLDPCGPDLGEGLPETRRGAVVAMAGYPGRIYMAIDAGNAGYSTVMCYNGIGYTEVWRAPLGVQISDIQIQAMPGTYDRLWIAAGDDIVRLPISLNPLTESGYPFTWESVMTTSWIYMNMYDVYKLYHSLKIFGQNLTASNQYIKIYYQTQSLNGTVEDEYTGVWTAITGDFDTTPSEEININVSGKKIRFSIHLYSVDATKTPVMQVMVLAGFCRVPVKWAYGVTFLGEDEPLDIEGDDDNYTRVETLLNQLDIWAANATPLTMGCAYSMFTNKTVFIDPAQLRPTGVVPDDQTEKQVCEMTLMEA